MTGLRKVMRGLKYFTLGLALVSVVLCFVADVLSYGGHGTAVLVSCLLGTGLLGLSIKLGGMPRWASGVAFVAFLLAAMKTSGGGIDSLENIMMAAFFAMFGCLALLIVPDRPRKAAPAADTDASHPAVTAA